MTESQDTQELRDQAREAILKKIAELTPLVGNPTGVKDLAEAYALVVSLDEEEAAPSVYER